MKNLCKIRDARYKYDDIVVRKYFEKFKVCRTHFSIKDDQPEYSNRNGFVRYKQKDANRGTTELTQILKLRQATK